MGVCISPMSESPVITHTYCSDNWLSTFSLQFPIMTWHCVSSRLFLVWFLFNLPTLTVLWLSYLCNMFIYLVSSGFSVSCQSHHHQSSPLTELSQDCTERWSQNIQYIVFQVVLEDFIYTCTQLLTSYLKYNLWSPTKYYIQMCWPNPRMQNRLGCDSPL